MLRRVLALVKKELLALLKSPQSRMVIIGPPLLQLVVFSYAASFDLHQAPYAVYDQDQSAASRRLLAGFEGSDAFGRQIRVSSEAGVQRVIDDRQALMLIRVHPRFQADLLADAPAGCRSLWMGATPTPL